MSFLMALALAGGSATGAELPRTITTIKVQIDQVARCLVRLAPRQSEAFLNTALMSPAEKEKGRILLAGHNHCLRQWFGLITPPSALRGAVAEAYFARDPALLDRIASRGGRSIGRVPVTDGRPFLIAYAVCVSTMAPARIAAFLRTPANTPAERAGFIKIGEPLRACMTEGASFHVDIASLRDELASIAYLEAVRIPEGV